MRTYPKIPSPYKRHTDGPNRNKFIIGDWATPELEYLQNSNWVWTEKIDGTNIRISWDGYKITYGGRTDNAQIPAKLITVLDSLLPEELLEQTFGNTSAILYGEGYGAGIQKGGVYRPDMSFILFDVLIGGFWLLRSSIEDIAKSLGIDCVPIMDISKVGTIHEAISAVKSKKITINSNSNSDQVIEGLVGVTSIGLLDRSGDRIMVKIKTKDF